MSRLAAATGTTFDKVFRTEMITHHQAPSRWSAPSPTPRSIAAKTLVGKIITGHAKEITEMKPFLATLR